MISAIDPDIVMQVTDFPNAPPVVNRYNGLKDRFTGIYTDSNENKLQKPLSNIELGDRKPLQLINEMMRLGGTFVTDQFCCD